MIREIINAILGLMIGPMSSSTMDVVLEKKAAEKGQSLNWRDSIVDLLKLLDMDSSVDARRRLAIELGYSGSAEDGSAEKNIWLHKAVLQKVAEGGIKV